jgi:uncharacterized membrane protein YedE/YeeE
MNIIYDPWPWYVAGPLIILVMFILLMLGRNFGMSSNLSSFCAMCGAGEKIDFFNFDWRSKKWNLAVVAGAIIGGFIGNYFLTPNEAVAISEQTVVKLQTLGFESAGNAYLPDELYANTVFSEPYMLFLLAIGGVLVGFGARYAGGCTSGHAISGLSNLQLPSLIAVIGFFIGGLIMVHLLFPLIF